MSKSIFVVMGSSGEYSSWSEWPIAAYDDIFKARRHAKMAQAAYNIQLNERILKELPISIGPDLYDPYRNEGNSDSSVQYTVVETAFLEELPKPGCEKWHIERRQLGMFVTVESTASAAGEDLSISKVAAADEDL